MGGLSEGQVLALLAGGIAASVPAGLAIVGIVELAACAVAWAWRRLMPLTSRGRHREQARGDERDLAGLQAELWPDGEWADVIKAYTEGDS